MARHVPYAGRSERGWLEWQLPGDETAARSFTGANCRLCTDAGAEIEVKGLLR